MGFVGGGGRQAPASKRSVSLILCPLLFILLGRRDVSLPLLPPSCPAQCCHCPTFAFLHARTHLLGSSPASTARSVLSSHSLPTYLPTFSPLSQLLLPFPPFLSVAKTPVTLTAFTRCLP